MGCGWDVECGLWGMEGYWCRSVVLQWDVECGGCWFGLVARVVLGMGPWVLLGVVYAVHGVLWHCVRCDLGCRPHGGRGVWKELQ